MKINTLNIIDFNMKNILSEVRVLLFQLLFIVLFFVFIHGVRLNNLFIPWSYDGDGLMTYQTAQTIKENGWVLNNSRLAAPFSGQFHDLMTFYTDNIAFLFFKLLLFFSNNIWLSVNLGYIFNCIVISFSSYLVMRSLNINYHIAMLASLTYALSTYFFFRGILHYFLSMYQFVPLSILLCIWCFKDDVFFTLNTSFFKYYKNILAVIFSLLIAENGNGYYPFFTCFFLLITGLIKSNFKINRKSMPALFLVFLIGVLFILNLTPHFLYDFVHNKNTHITHRYPMEAELYGLKITQLFLPPNAHRIPVVGTLISKYNNGILINENSWGFLGLFGSFGCIILLLNLFILDHKHDNRKVIFLLSRLNLAGILLATIGGFSSLFALLITPQLRAYNRISIFLLYFGILTVSLFFNTFLQNITKVKKLVFLCLIFTFSFLNILFQYPYGFSKKTNLASSFGSSFTSDAEFIKFIEDTMPKGAMIYQFPYMKFPEGGPINNLGDYRLLIGYMHSKKLKWSYGATRGRYPDHWHQIVNSLPIDTKIRILSIVGFEGIYIDRRAYTSSELKILEQSLSKNLRSPCYYSKDNKLSFFDMSKYNQEYRSIFSQEELTRIKGRIIEKANDDLFTLDFLLSLSGFYKITEVIDLRQTKSIYQYSGWSHPEEYGTWTEGSETVLGMNINSANDLYLHLNIEMIFNNNPVDVYINEVLLGSYEFVVGENIIPITNDLYPDKELVISFKFNNLMSPKDLGLSEDPRKLGIHVSSFYITE